MSGANASPLGRSHQKMSRPSKKLTDYTIDRKEEEKLFTDQERQANAEKSQRAREQFERDWEQEIRRARQAANLCVLCGHPLSAIARIGGETQHSGCKSFEE